MRARKEQIYLGCSEATGGTSIPINVARFVVEYMV